MSDGNGHRKPVTDREISEHLRDLRMKHVANVEAMTTGRRRKGGCGKWLLIAIAILIAIVLCLSWETMNVSAAGATDGVPTEQRGRPPEPCFGKCRVPICTYGGRARGITCIPPRHRIMQDLTQCYLTTVGGVVVCRDTCGGLSVPGTICTNE